MLAKILTSIMLGMLAAFAIEAPAVALAFEDVIPFEQRFERDVPGGDYLIGESRLATSLFLGGETLVAEFHIIQPHRTKEFGSGLSFIILDHSKRNYTRIAFGDIAGDPYVAIMINQVGPRALFGRRNPPALTGHLSIPLATVGEVSLQHVGAGRVILQTDGRNIPIELGFDPAHLVLQIFCSHSWVQFKDIDLLS